MQLSLGEVATYLEVSERTLRRWIATRGLPVHRAHERLHCNAIEIWEWAVENNLPVSRELLERARSNPDRLPPPLSALLDRGGVYRGLKGTTKTAVLHEIVKLLPLPADQDREFLAMVLEAREAMGSTGIGDGIALPHVRNPILLHVTEPLVALFLVDTPIDFDAIDGRPVHALFVIVSSSIPEHLRILAALGFVLRDSRVRQKLRDRSDPEAILARISAVEVASRPATATK